MFFFFVKCIDKIWISSAAYQFQIAFTSTSGYQKKPITVVFFVVRKRSLGFFHNNFKQNQNTKKQYLLRQRCRAWLVGKKSLSALWWWMSRMNMQKETVPSHTRKCTQLKFGCEGSSIFPSKAIFKFDRFQLSARWISRKRLPVPCEWCCCWLFWYSRALRRNLSALVGLGTGTAPGNVPILRQLSDRLIKFFMTNPPLGAAKCDMLRLMLEALKGWDWGEDEEDNICCSRSVPSSAVRNFLGCDSWSNLDIE